MKHFLLLLMLIVVVACPRDKRDGADSVPTDTIVLDTNPADLSGVTTSLPPQAPDTFRARPPTGTGAPDAPAIPRAPDALQQAAQRERSASEFCYREFGLKSDPTLRGNVGLVVTVNQTGVSRVRVGAHRWSSAAAGNQVNACLNERLTSAWKLSPGEVRPGTYQLQLTFSGD